MAISTSKTILNISANRKGLTPKSNIVLSHPISVPNLIPESQVDKKRFDSALRRKQLSLVLAGKLNPEDAKELKNVLFPNLK